jgi:hypothetical protein
MAVLMRRGAGAETLAGLVNDGRGRVLGVGGTLVLGSMLETLLGNGGVDSDVAFEGTT